MGAAATYSLTKCLFSIGLHNAYLARRDSSSGPREGYSTRTNSRRDTYNQVNVGEFIVLRIGNDPSVYECVFNQVRSTL